jgi:uncharacterized protein YdaU (DUF1376 family)
VQELDLPPKSDSAPAQRPPTSYDNTGAEDDGMRFCPCKHEERNAATISSTPLGRGERSKAPHALWRVLPRSSNPERGECRWSFFIGESMNYYEHHLGDYAQATAHLSFLEDAAYSRLIRKYYAQEKPLPADIPAVQRLVGARIKEEREAVEIVLREFFVLLDDGWHNRRCDEEIARYHDKQMKAKRSADARWSREPSQSDGNANAMRTHTEGNADGMLSSHQTPDTNHQSPLNTPKPPKPRVSAIVAETMPLPSQLPRENWREWVQYRSDIRKPLTEKSAEKQVKLLCECIQKGQDPICIIDQSIRNQWVGLFELKNSGRQQAESFYERDMRIKREEAAKWNGGSSSEPDDFLTIDAEVTHVPAIESH